MDLTNLRGDAGEPLGQIGGLGNLSSLLQGFGGIGIVPQGQNMNTSLNQGFGGMGVVPQGQNMNISEIERMQAE